MTDPAPQRPTLKVRFSSRGLGRRGFTPLVLPTSFDLDREGVGPELFRRLHLRLRLELESGRLAVPLISGQTFPVDVPEGCVGRGWVAAERSEGGDGPVQVTSAALTFDPPLVLHHIMPVLARLNTVFQDRELSDLLGRFGQLASGGPGVEGLRLLGRALGGRVRPRMERWLPEGSAGRERAREIREALRVGSNRIARVRLRHISARPVLRSGTWQLDLRFTGHLDLLDRAPVPFEEIHVPQLVIPYPYASLTRLLSGDPLATAAVRTDRIPTRDLAVALAGALKAFSGHLDLVTDLPEIAAAARMPDGGTLRLRARPPEPAHAVASFSGRVEPEVVAVEVDSLEVDLEGGRVGLEGRAELRLAQPMVDDEGVMALCAGAAVDGGLPTDRVRLQLSGRLLPEARLTGLSVGFGYTQPALKGEVALEARVDELKLAGDVAMELDPDTGLGSTQQLNLGLKARYSLLEGSRLSDGTTRVEIARLEGKLAGRLEATGADDARAWADAEASFALRSATQVVTLPELDIDEGDLVADTAGALVLGLRAGSARRADDRLELDFGGSRLGLTLEGVAASLGPRRLELPPGTALSATLLDAQLDSTGLGRSRVGLAYQLPASPVLSGPGAEPVELLVDELLDGDLELAVGPLGHLVISGPDLGLFDARYFNALLNPGDEVDRLFELLRDDRALDRVVAALRVFSAETADLAENLRSLARRFDRALEAEGISQPADAIPGPKLARLLSWLLVDNPSLEPRLHPLVKQVTDGEGLDVIATKRLLEEVLPPHEHGYEVDRAVRWLAQVLGPTEPPSRVPLREIPSLAEQPHYVAMFAALPAAGEIYRRCLGADPPPQGFLARICRVAPYLSLEQVGWLVATPLEGWSAPLRQRIEAIQAVKQRVRGISERYGGLGYAPQGLAISLFLSPVVGFTPVPGEEVPLIQGEPEGLLCSPDCLLGPRDVAVFLQAGLASPLQGRVVQHNQLLLLRLVLRQPPAFLRQVLVEMSQSSARILAAELNALLGMDQGALQEPLDLVALFSERLGAEIPRLNDFLAGGRRARHSYYEALNTVSETILAEAEPYVALRTWLQARRVSVPARPPLEKRLVHQAQRAQREADKLGRRCTFGRGETAKRQAAQAAFEESFALCAELVREQPRAFQEPWLKAYMARNYEALQVLSVVRNAQQRVDRVREWLKARTGKALPRAEQAQVEAVIDALYVYTDDRRALKRDPMVRLLLDPPEGRYDFTVVSAMGVVTDGVAGIELQDAFQRLEAQRGVRLVRADTANVRSLGYNARRIEEAVRQVTGPWGWIGYSQGCANGLWAETMMLSGTPEQQRLLEGFKARQMLFSAVNGSAHGSAGDLKFLRAMVDGDRFLSHYQAIFSRQATLQALRVLRLLLDSPVAVKTMGGADSLSWEGVIALSRELQIVDTAPTTILRGVVREPILPEALEFLSHILTRQIESAEHDTQVAVDEAVGHPVHVGNAWARRMADCDIGCRAQATHHWSPLFRTTEFITTKRDRERSIYDMPKDRHVFPWIELNARFGIIGAGR